jgi:hypothetical protein
LKGGKSYSNIFTGGADEARYCIQTMRLRSLRHLISSVKLCMILALQPQKIFRILGYGILEAGLAWRDFFRGVGQGKNFFKELKFIPTRVLVCILLRELIRIRVKIDVARGAPIVHASFLGYDEQSHRRGPESAFAHWTLKGIDAAVADIHRAMQKSRCRIYRMVVYSDHGQEAVVPFEKHLGKSPQAAIMGVIVNAVGSAGAAGRAMDTDEPAGRRRRAHGFLFERRFTDERRMKNRAEQVQIAAMGPIGHIYLFSSAIPKKETLAEALVRDAKIPTVLLSTADAVIAVNRKGRFNLEKSPREVLGAAHPLAERTARDLARTCRHPHAGDLIISGWSPQEQPLSFAVENGAHGGPGAVETSGFVMLPNEMDGSSEVLRPLDLRARVFELFGKPSADGCRTHEI